MRTLIQGLKTTAIGWGQSIAAFPDLLRSPKLLFFEFLTTLRYFVRNPWRVQSDYARKTGRGEPHQYGETPIPVMKQVCDLAEIGPDDHFLDLGSGLGRFCFRLRLMEGTTATGIEEIPLFRHGSSMIAESLRIDRLEFLEEDFTERESYTEFTVVYFYELFFEDETTRRILEHLHATLSPGSRLVTVSYPAEEYAPGRFEVTAKQEATFPWGKTEIYVQEPVSKS